VVHVDPQHLPEHRPQILPVSLRVTLWSGVTHADVEEPVGPELDAASAVHVGRAGEFDDGPRGLTGVALQVGRRALL
jgi:hypothetical protein